MTIGDISIIFIIILIIIFAKEAGKFWKNDLQYTNKGYDYP